jgi:hypothetical protein
MFAFQWGWVMEVVELEGGEQERGKECGDGGGYTKR